MKKLILWVLVVMGMCQLKANMPEEVFNSYPTVYAIGNEYQIIVSVKKSTLMGVEVNGKKYYDASNGILRSESPTHILRVPMAELDKAKKYTIFYREIEGERLPYFNKTTDVKKLSFNFRPVQGDNIKIYSIADAHNRVGNPVAAGEFWGKDLDLLILNGDIPDDGRKIENFVTIHKIAGLITKGEIPVIYSRGNHDMRGKYAEKLSEHSPTQNGNSYFTFRVGSLWGIVLDCGEDKPDTNVEYGNTIVCHEFRLRQTEFLKQVIANSENEYNQDGVKYKIVVSHVPFAERNNPPFNIEEDIYREWCKLLREEVKPHLMICGHKHKQYLTLEKSEKDYLGQPCPVVVGSQPLTKKVDGRYYDDGYRGTAIELTPNVIDVLFTDHKKQVVKQYSIDHTK